MSGNRRFIAWVLAICLPSIAFVVATNTVSGTWERVRTQPKKRTLRVTGAATMRIVSDLIEWDAQVMTTASGQSESAQALAAQIAKVSKYLADKGISESEIRASSVHSSEIIERRYVTEGERSFNQQIPKGWSTKQTISVRSNNIELVERVSREVTELLAEGIAVSSSPPLYHYTKLDELKIDMLAKASENARIRAENIVDSGGGGKGKLGDLWNADMGVININPANSSATSWEGNNDKTSYEKDIITIVHLTSM